MPNVMDWANRIVGGLTPLPTSLPDGLFDSFQYTTTGNNYCHPMTWGLLAKILLAQPEVEQVGIDLRLNNINGVKFQPDLVAFDASGNPLVFVDYESPNSSDARIPQKDVVKYCEWNATSKAKNIPYIIVTTLPDSRRDDWELRYVHGDGYNARFKGRSAEVRQNPFRFWYKYYRQEFAQRCMDHIAMVNINGKQAHVAFPER